MNAFFDRETFNFPGYIELYNKGSKAATIKYFILSDNIHNPYKFKLPANLTIHLSIAVYINGKYLGLMDLWEKMDKNYLSVNFGMITSG
ncbi:MAG: hypothetical protein HC905_00525 [Bacteroidales bacterium]|nr:hypothetical protein [Bacteroidales bacterium]